MSNIKFTSDGKKVIIVGKLNAQETIVQEIFVSQSGAEIPSGENFVVKSLHDEPAKSWKEKNLEGLEARFNRDSRDWERKIEEQNKKMRAAYDRLDAEYKSVASNLKEISPEAFDLIGNFLGGKITHLVKDGYGCMEIEEWGKSVLANEYGFKLITIMGNPNKGLSAKLNDYSDGSGRSTTIVAFTSYQDAKDYLQKHIDEKKEYGEQTLIAAQKHNITLDPEKVAAYHNKNLESAQKQLIENEKRRNDILGQINEITAKIEKA